MVQGFDNSRTLSANTMQGTAIVGIPLQVLSTEGVPESERFDFWHEALCQRFLSVDCVRTTDGPFSGKIETTEVNGVGFSRVKVEGTKIYRTPSRIRDNKEKVLIVSVQTAGSCCLVQDDREARLSPGDFACCDSSRPYEASVSDQCEQVVVHLPLEVWVRRFGHTDQLTARAVRSTTHVGALVFNFLQQITSVVGTLESLVARRVADASLDLLTTALAGEISPDAARNSEGRIALLYRAKAFIEANLHDPHLDREKIAAALNISIRYLQSLFQEQDTSVCTWIWKQRLEKCRRDLADPLLRTKSVGQIAFDCGFSDLSHFTHRFKATFGVTPSDYRHEVRAEKQNMALPPAPSPRLLE